MTFTWKWSYQNRAGYQFDGGEIEVHRENVWVRDYQRSTHNGDDESFQRNVIDPIGGAIVRNHAHRWTPELYEAFKAYWTASYEADRKCRDEFRAKHPDVEFNVIEPITIPRPIFWNDDAGRFETESFYQGGKR